MSVTQSMTTETTDLFVHLKVKDGYTIQRASKMRGGMWLWRLYAPDGECIAITQKRCVHETAVTWAKEYIDKETG